MKKLVPLLLALLLLVAACGTGGKQSSDKSNGKLKVVTTIQFYMIWLKCWWRQRRYS